MFLFGSRSKGLERNLSDYDVAVYFNPENPRMIEFEENKVYPLSHKIWDDLDSILKREVDLLVLNNANVSLAAEIVTKGTPIIIKNRNIYLKFMLLVTDLAEDWRNFIHEYYQIYQCSKSLTDEDRKNLEALIVFIENEFKEQSVFKDMVWLEYQENSIKRKATERWIENIMKALIDVSKILLSANKKISPKKLVMSYCFSIQ